MKLTKKEIESIASKVKNNIEKIRKEENQKLKDKFLLKNKKFLDAFHLKFNKFSEEERILISAYNHCNRHSFNSPTSFEDIYCEINKDLIKTKNDYIRDSYIENELIFQNIDNPSIDILIDKVTKTFIDNEA